MTFSEKIINLRRAHGWSQEDFAEKLNISRQAISRWENDSALPDALNILQISKLFGVTTDYLLNDDYTSDEDIPAIKNATQETDSIVLKKKQWHFIAAICFTLASFCWIMALAYSSNTFQLGLFLLCTRLLYGQRSYAVRFVFQEKISISTERKLQ